MTNAHNTRKKPSGRSAATNPKPPAVTATTARKAAYKKKKGNQVSNNENYPRDPSDDPNADANRDDAGEPLPDRQNAPHRNDVSIQELIEKYTETQGE
jgi:hypothetical protein